MISGVTRHMLPHVSGVPHFHLNKPLNVGYWRRADGRNTVSQQLPTLLDVTCCVRLHTLLHFVACCWKLLRSVKSVKLLATCKRTQQHNIVDVGVFLLSITETFCYGQ